MKEIKDVLSVPSLCLEIPELFYATRVTDTPLESIESSLLDAINEVQKSENIDLSDQVDQIVSDFGDYIDSVVENTATTALLLFIDNLIINYDYYEFVEEFVNNLSD